MHCLMVGQACFIVSGHSDDATVRDEQQWKKHGPRRGAATTPVSEKCYWRGNYPGSLQGANTDSQPQDTLTETNASLCNTEPFHHPYHHLLIAHGLQHLPQ
jgi:hypothetical protein